MAEEENPRGYTNSTGDSIFLEFAQKSVKGSSRAGRGGEGRGGVHEVGSGFATEKENRALGRAKSTKGSIFVEPTERSERVWAGVGEGGIRKKSEK